MIEEYKLGKKKLRIETYIIHNKIIDEVTGGEGIKCVKSDNWENYGKRKNRKIFKLIKKFICNWGRSKGLR